MPLLKLRWPLAGIFLLLLSLCLSNTALHAQQIHRPNTDSIARARQHTIDSTRTAQKAAMDAAKAIRQHSMDSLKASRLHLTDSLAAIRKYRESKHFKDSVTKSREAKINGVRNASKARMDALKAARQHSTDSMLAVRKSRTDILKASQKKRTDSIAAIQKYRTSKRFTDSVTVVRRIRLDSVRAVRKAFSESLAAARKKTLDSTKAIHKAFTDSLTASRKLHTDSLKAKNKIKADALVKAKADKAKVDKAKEKKKLTDMSLKVELGRKKKQEKWDNSKMLKKKWSLPRQVVQNTFTRYNYYFNANRKMEEAVGNMHRIGKEDYDRPIPLFSFDPSKDSTRFAADMDSVIQKASLGIQIHDPRGKWEDDLYLLLGQAYFYKGNFEQASNSFRYIVAQQQKLKLAADKKKAAKTGRSTKKDEPSFVTPDNGSMLDFLKHEPANNDALLWLARTYVQSGKNDAAESILDLMAADSKFPESLKGELALEIAHYDLAVRNYKDATKQLAIVSADKSQDQYTRRRAAYLDGQLLQEQGAWTNAAAQFDLVTDLNPKLEMDFYARKSRAYSLMQAGSGTDVAIASLKSMLHDNKYITYYEQVYYLLGQLSANAGNIPDAEKYLNQGLTSAKTTKKQKAISFATLGDVYYRAGSYERAKLAYDSAARLVSSAQDDPGVKQAVVRSKVLDKVTSPSRVIRAQDSLLALSALSDKEQRSIVRRYIRSLNRKLADSNAVDENAGILAAQQQNEDAGGDANLSWYFNNPQLLQQGNTEFKRKWGSRPLADNWRRASTAGFASATGAGVDNAGSGNTNNDDAGNNSSNGKDQEASLLAAIPNSKGQKEIADKAIQRAYVDLATAYIRQLEDYPDATATLDTLGRRYTTHPNQAEAVYLRYLIALRQNNLTAAKNYSDTLIQRYDGTSWAALVKPASEDGANSDASTQASVSEYYDETYSLMMQRDWPQVLTRARAGRQHYPDEMYGNRFRIMEATALAGQRRYGPADSIVSEFLRTHPADTLHSWAEGVQAYVQRQKAIDTVNVNSAPPPPTPPQSVIPVPASSTITRGTDSTRKPVPAEYIYNAQAKHYFVFLYNKLESKMMGVRAALGDFNSMYFSGQSLESAVVPLAANAEGMVVTKSFKNAARAKEYAIKFKGAPQIVREFKNDEYRVFIISESNYQKLLADKSSTKYLSFYKAHY